MNFQYITPIETPAVLLDIAFRRAREKSVRKNLTGNWLQIIRQKEAMKLDIIKDNLCKKLEKILDDFPASVTLSDFYIKIMKLTLDYPQYKKSLGAVNWALERIRTIHKSFVRMVIKEKERPQLKALVKQFYGRVSSFLKQIEINMSYLEKCRKIMRTYPDIKEMFTICIYGFPNVGKTTLLNALASTSAKVAAYAFTTKSVNVGYVTLSGKKVQVCDVPGTLARINKRNNIEKQADLVLHDVANLIIYVFDIGETCGYSLEMQRQLLENIKGSKPILVYLSKTDLIDSSIVSNFEHKSVSLAQLKKEIKAKLPKED